MDNIIEFTIPLRTISESNNTDHWAKKSKRKKNQNFFVAAFLNSHTIEKKIPLPCQISLTRIAPRKLDYDNLVTSFKGIRDCLADKVIPGLAPGRADSDPRISWEYTQEKGDPGYYGIKVKIAPSYPPFPS